MRPGTVSTNKVEYWKHGKWMKKVFHHRERRAVKLCLVRLVGKPQVS